MLSNYTQPIVWKQVVVGKSIYFLATEASTNQGQHELTVMEKPARVISFPGWLYIRTFSLHEFWVKVFGSGWANGERKGTGLPALVSWHCQVLWEIPQYDFHFGKVKGPLPRSVWTFSPIRALSNLAQRERVWVKVCKLLLHLKFLHFKFHIVLWMWDS